VRFTLGLLMLVPVLAQDAPDAASLLARQASELQRYHSYRLTQDMTMDMKMPGMAMPAMTSTIVTQAVNPGKMRMEMKTSGMDAMLMISDGKDTWMYMPLFKQYSKMPAEGTEDMQSMMGGIGIAAMPDITKTGAAAKVVRSEMLEVDGQPHDCWVIEVQTQTLAGAQAGAEPGDRVFTSWVDKALGIQLKMSVSGKSKASAAAPEVEVHMVTTTHSMKFNEDLPDSLFIFTPPADAQETKELIPGMGAIAGGAAAAEKTAPKAQPSEPEAFIPSLNPIERIEPEYPPEARSQGLQGDVDLLVTIDPAGAVVKAEALTGRGIFRPVAVDTVKQWRFRPVFRDGHPVFAYTQANVDFFLNTGKPVSPEDLDFDLAEQMKSTQQIQELTSRFPRSPEQVLADSEEQIRGQDGIERFYALTDLPKQALDAGALEKASSYALELLQSANDQKGDWNYGNAIYDANMVLGLVALRQGNVTEARRYLLESGKTPGSPQLDSFGPDLTLAQELLEKGERDTVLEFLTLCKGFWKMGADRLDAMAAEVRKGGKF
jgi:TonB family protein